MTPMEELREQAAIAARDAMVAMEWPPQDGDRQIDEVMAAIRAIPLPAPVALPQAGEVEPEVLTCDVRLPPATVIRAGCTFDTLRLAMKAEHRPRHFSETSGERQARELMNPGFGSVTAPAGGQSYGMAIPPASAIPAAAVGEPVAWMYERLGLRAAVSCERDPVLAMHHTETPLYAALPTPDDGWMSIETAPKDGVAVLGYGPLPGYNAQDHGWHAARETKWKCYPEGSPGHAKWLAGKGPIGIGWDWYEPVHNWSHVWSPTHWMPLPAPPAALSTATGDEGGKV